MEEVPDLVVRFGSFRLYNGRVSMEPSAEMLALAKVVADRLAASPERTEREIVEAGVRFVMDTRFGGD